MDLRALYGVDKVTNEQEKVKPVRLCLLYVSRVSGGSEDHDLTLVGEAAPPRLPCPPPRLVASALCLHCLVPELVRKSEQIQTERWGSRTVPFISFIASLRSSLLRPDVLNLIFVLPVLPEFMIQIVTQIWNYAL